MLIISMIIMTSLTTDARSIMPVKQRQIDEIKMYPTVDFAADKYWAVRFELNEDELDLIRTMRIEFDARTLTTYQQVFRGVQVQFVVHRGGHTTYVMKMNRKFGGLKNNEQRKTLKLSDGQVRKLKLQIFDNENLARFGKTDVNYEITDATPVLILGVMNMTNNNGRRRRETHLSRSKRASFHRSEPCGETYQYLVDLNSLMPGKKSLIQYMDIGACTNANTIHHSRNGASMFDQSRNQCSMTSSHNLLSENAHAWFRKHASSKHKFDNPLLCVPAEYSAADIIFRDEVTKKDSKETFSSLKLKKCQCR